MSSTLFLTSAEKALYEKLSLEIKQSLNLEVQDEKGTAYETIDDLQLRASVVTAELDTASKKIAEKFFRQVQREAPKVSLAEVPESLVSTFLFLIGATGICPMIASLLEAARSAEDLYGIVALANARHFILETNQGALSLTTNAQK